MILFKVRAAFLASSLRTRVCDSLQSIRVLTTPFILNTRRREKSRLLLDAGIRGEGVHSEALRDLRIAGKQSSKNSAAPVWASSLGMRAGAALSAPSASVFPRLGFREFQVVRASFRFPPAELCVSFLPCFKPRRVGLGTVFPAMMAISDIWHIDPVCRNRKNSALRNGFESSSIVPDLFRKMPDGRPDGEQENQERFQCSKMFQELSIYPPCS